MLTQHQLNEFTGDLMRWKHFPPSLLYTPGVKYLCENGGKGEGESASWWLLDAIASYQPGKKINCNADLRSLQFWKLTVNDNKGVLTCDDGNGNIVITQRIHKPDFCLPEIKIWVGDNGDGTRTAYLPSEH